MNALKINHNTAELRIIGDVLSFKVHVKYPQYFTKEFSDNYNEQLKEIFKKTGDDLIVDLLTNAEGLMLEMIDYIKKSKGNFKLLNNFIEEYKRRIITYDKHKTAYIKLLKVTQKMKPNHISEQYSLKDTNDYLQFAFTRGGYQDYFVLGKDVLEGMTGDITFKDAMFTILLKIRFFKNVEKYILEGSIKNIKKRNLKHSVYHPTNKEYFEMINKIFKKINRVTTKNTSKRIDSLRSPKGYTVYEVAIYLGKEKNYINRQLALEIGMMFGKTPYQVRKYLAN